MWVVDVSVGVWVWVGVRVWVSVVDVGGCEDVGVGVGQSKW